VALAPLDLMPRADGTPPYRTIDEWLVGRIDRIVAESLQRPGFRLLALALVAEAGGFVGVILAAPSLPGLGGAAL